MRILATITETHYEGDFLVITAKDVRNYYHTLFFEENKAEQIFKEYDTKYIVDKYCILEETDSGRPSSFLQTDLCNEGILNDNNLVKDVQK